MKARLRRKIAKNWMDKRGVRFIVPTKRYGRSTKNQVQIQHCRMEQTDWSDEIMVMSGCSGEFANDFRKQDMAEGCPRCTNSILDNASEPDVMARWELTRCY